MKILPTIGRIVWYYPNGAADIEAEVQPLAAQIAYVHSEERINIGYLNAAGAHLAATSVKLIQEGEPAPSEGFCMWMPYQQGQAKKAAEPTALELGAAARAAGPAEKY